MKKIITSVAATALMLTGTALYAQTSEQSTPKQESTPSTPNTTQSQGGSAGGTSAWPQATGTTGATTPDSQTPSATQRDTMNKTNTGTQTQGNSAQGTAAWPQATGTAGSSRTTPPDSSTKKMRKKDRNKGSNDPQKR